MQSEEEGPKKKVDRRSEHERRLMGDFSAPPTALPIRVPKGSDSDEADQFGKTRTMAQPKPGRQGHRPMDTLGRSPHAPNVMRSRNTGPFANFTTKRNEVQTSNSFRQTIEPGKKQSTAAPSTNRYGDGFEMNERSRTSHNPHKRQRLAVASTNPVRSSSPVDLTGEDDLEVVGVNGRGLPATSKRSQNGYVEIVRPPQPFEASEFRRIDAMTSTASKKRRRKSKDGQGSSQASSHETPADAVNGYSKPNGQSIQQTLDEELMDDRRQIATEPTLPEINLRRGWNKINRPLSDVSKADTRALQKPVSMMNQTRRQATAGRGSPRGARGQQNIRRTTVLQETSLGSSGQVGRPMSPRLNEKFIRDEPEQGPEPMKTTAKQRMKATSQSIGQRVSPIKDGSDSADELAGETTVRSQASRSASPQKRTRPHFGNAHTVNGNKQPGSPSDLQPTQFTQSSRRGRANVRSLEWDDRYKLRAFYATSCVLTRGDIEMRYDESEKQFDIYLDGDIQVVRAMQTSVSIGKSEVSRLDYSSGKHRVHLFGPRTRLSNGHICVEFFGWKNVQDFMNQLLFVTGDHMKLELVQADRLQKLFLMQSSQIETSFKKQNEKREKREVDDMARTVRDDYGHAAEEEIKYEPFQSLRSTARQSTASRLKKEARSLQSSPYFESMQPRRSSRQARPIKRLTPSPPPPLRWTRVNKPQRWAHSVVYPPEGLRRVTVDFQDLEKLDEGEFLNDNLISFALRQIEEKMAPEHKQEVYFFNSFFYTALTTKNGKISFNYNAVKRWTKNIDLLSYPFVVVPINNSFHWFVAIICNLQNISRKSAGLDIDDEPDQIPADYGTVDDPRTSPQSGTEDQGVDAEADERGSGSPHPDRVPSSRTLTDGVGGPEIQEQTEAMRQLSLSQEDGKSKVCKVEGDGGIVIEDPAGIESLSTPLDKTTRTKKSKKRAPPPLKKYDPDQPTIITLDSMASGHAPMTRHLKDYLREEAEAKRGMDLDTKQLQGMTAKGTPEQSNFSDCGLYLIGFVEQFAKNPREFITRVLTRQLDKEADFADFDASAKRDSIRAELLKLNEAQDADRKAKKSAKKTNTPGIPNHVASSPTRAPSKDPNPVVSQTPALVQKIEADAVGIAEPQVQPTDPIIPPNTSFDTGEEDLDVAVPRPLAPAPRNPTTAVQGADLEASPAIVAPEQGTEQIASSIINYQEQAGPIDEQQDLERLPSNEPDEEMLDTADEPNEDGNAFRSNTAELGSGSDLLQSFENAVESRRQELENAADNAAVDPNPLQPSYGKLNRARNKTSIKPADVIDLDAQDAEPEVPESPQEKQTESRTRRHGRHTKFL